MSGNPATNIQESSNQCPGILQQTSRNPANIVQLSGNKCPGIRQPMSFNSATKKLPGIWRPMSRNPSTNIQESGNQCPVIQQQTSWNPANKPPGIQEQISRILASKTTRIRESSIPEPASSNEHQGIQHAGTNDQESGLQE